MRMIRYAVAAALLAPLPAIAQTEVADAPDAVDPARLELGRKVVGKVFPKGTYRKLMGSSMDKLMNSVMDGAMALPIGQVAALGGLEPEKAAALDESTIGEIMAIYDPNYRERARIGMRAMMDSMTDLMDGFEPKVQAGLSRAYARRFSVAQLSELDAFFSTPTGSFYAAESMALYMDPEIVSEMQAMMPEMMAKMPDFMKAMTEATKHLPPARKLEEISDADRKKLAKLLDVKEDELRDVENKDMMP